MKHSYISVAHSLNTKTLTAWSPAHVWRVSTVPSAWQGAPSLDKASTVNRSPVSSWQLFALCANRSHMRWFILRERSWIISTERKRGRIRKSNKYTTVGGGRVKRCQVKSTTQLPTETQRYYLIHEVHVRCAVQRRDAHVFTSQLYLTAATRRVCETNQLSRKILYAHSRAPAHLPL